MSGRYRFLIDFFVHADELSACVIPLPLLLQKLRALREAHRLVILVQIRPEQEKRRGLPRDPLLQNLHPAPHPVRLAERVDIPAPLAAIVRVILVIEMRRPHDIQRHIIRVRRIPRTQRVLCRRRRRDVHMQLPAALPVLPPAAARADGFGAGGRALDERAVRREVLEKVREEPGAALLFARNCRRRAPRGGVSSAAAPPASPAISAAKAGRRVSNHATVGRSTSGESHHASE
mmetsp:Transcript_22526/g.55879  ORF Transcript_22526/g.55879 Transcript_22526/m.55879 type:complete len:233 (-) Transcript_22526:189-887(-)